VDRLIVLLSRAIITRSILLGGDVVKYLFRGFVGVGLFCVVSPSALVAHQDVFLWDLDGVVLKRKNMLQAAWSYPHKRELVRQLSYPVLRDAVTAVFGRRVFGHKGAGEQVIHLARQHNIPQLEEFVLTVANAKEPMPDTVEIMMRLHEAEYTQYIGTNMGKTLFDDLAKREDLSFFHDWFDMPASQFVTLEGLKRDIYKPKHAFFEDFLARNNLPASQVIFIDDKAENVKAAREVGMRAIRFTNARALENELEKLGVMAGGVASLATSSYLAHTPAR